jgi:CIC family chloride channel protein
VAGVIFAPAVSIGAALAAALAVVLGGLWPALVPDPAAFILAGMAGFTAALSNAPLAAILFIAEVGHSVDLLAPGAWVVALAWIAGRGAAPFPLAEERARPS